MRIKKKTKKLSKLIKIKKNEKLNIYKKEIRKHVLNYVNLKKKIKYHLLIISVRKRNVFLNLATLTGFIIKRFSMGLEKQGGKGRRYATMKNFLASLVGDKLVDTKVYTLSLIFKGSSFLSKHITFGLGDNIQLLVKKQLVRDQNISFNGCKKEKLTRKKKRRKRRSKHNFRRFFNVFSYIKKKNTGKWLSG
jgi:hypothetical protein